MASHPRTADFPSDFTARRANSKVTLLATRMRVFPQTSDGRWMFSHDGTPRSTIYALDNPAKSIAIPVSRNQVAISFEEMGNEESGPPRPPPSEDRFGGGGPPTPPDTLGSINTGI